MLETYQARYPTPFAVLGVRTAGERLAGIDYLPRGAATLDPLTKFAERVCRQIERYLDDPSHRFDLPFDYRGTEFQCRVWRAIAGIPSGRTLTYVDVARKLRTAPRPVGGAAGIGGFMHSRRGPGIEIKRWLLRHEGASAGDGQWATGNG